MQVSGRLWEHVVASLHALKEPSALIAWLPNHQPDGKAGAAASLLGNLAQVSASALQGKVHFCEAKPPALHCTLHPFMCLATSPSHPWWGASCLPSKLSVNGHFSNIHHYNQHTCTAL